MKMKKLLGIMMAIMMAVTMSIPMTAFGDNVNDEQNNNGNISFSEGDNASESTEEPNPVEKAEQTISFNQNISVDGINTLSFGDEIDLDAEAEGSISYTVDDEGIIEIDQETGIVKGVGIGQATITVKAAETDNYNEATTVITFNVVKADQKIEFSEAVEAELQANDNTLSIEVGETRNLHAKTYDNSTCTFIIDSPSNRILIDKYTGVLSASDEFEAETATVTVVAPSSVGYKSAQRSFKVTLVDRYDGVSMEAIEGFNSRSTTIYRLFDGETWGEPLCGEPTEILSDVVDRVLAKTINIWSGYKYVKSPQTVTVNQQEVSMVLGSTDQIKATADTDLSFSSNNEDVVTVDKDGLLTANGVGDAIVTVEANENEWFKASDPIEVNVTVIEQGQSVISLETDTIVKAIGEKSFNIGASLTTGDGTLKFSSSNTKVATIDASGNVKILKPGSTVFTVRVADTQFYKGTSNTVKCTVKEKPPAPTLSVKAIGKKKIKLTWSKVEGASKYQIYTYVNKKKKTLAGNEVPDNSALKTITNTKLKAGKTYKYKIRAIVKVNGKTYYSPWSAVKKAKCKK